MAQMEGPTFNITDMQNKSIYLSNLNDVYIMAFTAILSHTVAPVIPSPQVPKQYIM